MARYPVSPEAVRRALESQGPELADLCSRILLADRRAQALVLDRADVARIHAGPLSFPIALDASPLRSA